MPYTIKKSGDEYLVVKKSSGKVVAHCDSKKDAGIYVWKAEGADKKKGKK